MTTATLATPAARLISAFNRSQYRDATITPGRKPSAQLVNGILEAHGLYCRARSHRNGTWTVSWFNGQSLANGVDALHDALLEALGVPVTDVDVSPRYAEWRDDKALISLLITFRFEDKAA